MIDTRELHIGAHVDVRIRDLIEHKRVRICRINDDNEVCCKRANDKGLLAAYAYHLQPIPLTAELLTEIGFELTGDWGEYKVYTKQNITVRIVGERMYAKVAPNLGTLIDVKYLHELENFVYMSLHKELIEE